MLLTACLAFLLVAESANPGRHRQGTLELLVSTLPLAAIYMIVLFGRRIRLQEAQTEQLLIELEESRGAELRAAALAERQRLARDMHDVLAHSLSGLLLQLEGARLLAVANPADERLAGTIDRAHELAKSGLDEARRAIGMLRDDELPGPDRLAALTEAFQADTGVAARFTSSGPPRELASSVRLALYRVTQEALTNVRKHAHPDRLEVRLEYIPDEVSVVIEDFASHPVGPRAPGRRRLWPHRHARTRRAARRHPGRRPDRYRLPGPAAGADVSDAEDPRAGGGRPARGARGPGHAARPAARRRGGRHRGGRRGGAGPGGRAEAGCDPDGPADAPDGRSRGHPAAARARSRGQGGGADHLRRRPLGHRRAAGGRARLPDQGRGRGRDPAGPAPGGRRRGGPRPGGATPSGSSRLPPLRPNRPRPPLVSRGRRAGPTA